MVTRRDILCQCAGGAGAVVSCAGMIASLAAGLAGTVGSAVIQRTIPMLAAVRTTLIHKAEVSAQSSGSPTTVPAGSKPFYSTPVEPLAMLALPSLLRMLLMYRYAGPNAA